MENLIDSSGKVPGSAQGTPNPGNYSNQGLSGIPGENRPLNTIIADDEPYIIELLTNFCMKNNLPYRKATNGLEVLEHVKNEKPDLIIIDLMMPYMDGFDLIKAIRSNLQLSDVYIIVQTARAEIEDKLKGYSLGADDYITKPWKMWELSLRVNAARRLIALRYEATDLKKRLAITQLIRGLSHEFTQPLTSILGNLKLMRLKQEKGTMDSEGLEQYISKIEEATRRLSSLIRTFSSIKNFDPDKDVVEILDILRLCEKTSPLLVAGGKSKELDTLLEFLYSYKYSVDHITSMEQLNLDRKYQIMFVFDDVSAAFRQEKIHERTASKLVLVGACKEGIELFHCCLEADFSETDLRAAIFKCTF